MSWFSGNPVEMYHFQRGSQHWYVTTAKRSVTVNSQTFTPGYVSRENIRSSGDKGREQINLVMSKDHPMIMPYAGGPPAFPTNVTILRAEADDGTFRFIWSGRIVSTEFQKSEAKIRCEPISTTLRRLGLRRPYQVLCPLVLYDATSCRATQVKVDSSVVALASKTVTVTTADSFVVGAFSGGKLFKGNAIFMILEHTIVAGQHVLVLSTPQTGIVVSDVVQITRGCSHDEAGCRSFNNLDNYGGFLYMPQRNPFGLNPII